MLCADPVMDTGQPCLEISEDEMDDGQELLGHFGIPAFRNGVVIVAELPQAGVTTPIVRDDQRPRSDGAIDKSTKRFGAAVSGDCQPNAPRIAPILSLVLRGSRLPMAHLNGAGDQNLMVNASAFAADPGPGGPFRRAVCGGSERLSRNAIARVAVGTGDLQDRVIDSPRA